MWRNIYYFYIKVLLVLPFSHTTADCVNLFNAVFSLHIIMYRLTFLALQPSIYRVAQLKSSQLTFLFVKFEWIDKIQ